MAIVVQTLSRSKTILAQQLVQSSSAVIGRGFYSDIRIDDPYVCDQHLSIAVDDDKRIWIADKGSLNGMKVNGKSINQASVGPEDVITIGQSHFRVFVASQAIAPTKKLNPLDTSLESISKKRYFAILMSLFIGFALLEGYFNTFTELEYSILLSNVLSGLIALCIAPLFIGLLSILNKKEAHFITQFNLVLIGMLAISIIGYFAHFINFNLNSPTVISLLETLIFWLMLSLGFWLMLYVAFHQSNGKRALITASFVAFIVCIQLLPTLFNDRDYVELPPIDASIMNPSALITSSSSTQAFMSDAQGLFDSASDNDQN
ncbi:FHA domain-containing protein [Glaciecola sp. SC05]|uniref:FHA domain-containing protein n=1 Tax=Glaciecola sp. SC05 TaxID=1987355 RepID=UPI003529C88A